MTRLLLAITPLLIRHKEVDVNRAVTMKADRGLNRRSTSCHP
jgi:hypothetical protein